MTKAFNILKNILFWLVIGAAAFMVITMLLSLTVFRQNGGGIFGYRFLVVQSDSMSATDFAAGDIVVSKKVDPSTLKEGDIITFISHSSISYGKTVTHKIRKLTTDAEGNPGFVTYGTTTDTDDEAIVTYPYVIGKYVGHIPVLGRFFSFVKTTPGYMVCVFVPFLLLIFYQGLNVTQLFRKYKKEQTEELEEERRKLEEERKQTAEMQVKLKELQAALDAMQNENAPKTEKPTPSSEDADTKRSE